MISEKRKKYLTKVAKLWASTDCLSNPEELEFLDKALGRERANRQWIVVRGKGRSG